METENTILDEECSSSDGVEHQEDEDNFESSEAKEETVDNDNVGESAVYHIESKDNDSNGLSEVEDDMKESLIDKLSEENQQDVSGPSECIDSSLSEKQENNIPKDLTGQADPSKPKKQYHCTICDYSSNYKNHIKSHTDAVHLKLKRHKCDFCSFATAQRYNLRVHINAVHLNLKHDRTRNLKELTCNQCDFVTKYKATLETHINKVHLKVKHKCDLCDFVTDQKRSLKMHIDVIHLNLRPHKCDLCEFATNVQQGLKRHIKTVHSSTSQTAAVNSDSKRKKEYFKCELCGESITNLSTHMNSVHLKINKFKCDMCSYGSNQKNALIKHLESVHQKLRHACKECDFSADRFRNLRNHIDEVHSTLNTKNETL